MCFVSVTQKKEEKKNKKSYIRHVIGIDGHEWTDTVDAAIINMNFRFCFSYRFINLLYYSQFVSQFDGIYTHQYLHCFL